MSSQYRGIFPAMQLPFKPDLSVDEPELRRFATWLAGHDGIAGLVTNGHTGEVFALSAGQRAEATRIVADELEDKMKSKAGCPSSLGFAARASRRRSNMPRWLATPARKRYC